MARDPRYDILFEPVRIGPVTARNRFFQVPHCNGMGNSYPSSMAAMRGMKAEGGWAVVCTEETDFHPSGDILPFVEGRLWDRRDIKILTRMTDAVFTSLKIVRSASSRLVNTRSWCMMMGLPRAPGS